jgi:Tfp pilus assembly protein PilV
MKTMSQKGDTIVEVLIAMTVLATVIAGAYAISNKSMISAQQAQERTQATKLAEGQVDRLKYIAGLTNQTQFEQLILSATPNKCIDSNNVVKGKNTSQCKDSNNLFNFYISSYDFAQKQFTIKVNWYAFHSNTQQNVTFLYRVEGVNP